MHPMGMKSLLGIFALAGVSLASASAVSAADDEGRFAVRGVGGQPCSRMISFIESEDEDVRRTAILAYEAWFSGYLSHINRSAEGTFDASPIINGREMLSILLSECREQPEALTETIAAGVIAALAQAKVETESDVITISDGERTIRYRRGTLVNAQEKLKELGHLSGSADGIFGPGTSAAVSAFQKAQGIEETGFLDTNTLVQLLLND